MDNGKSLIQPGKKPGSRFSSSSGNQPASKESSSKTEITAVQLFKIAKESNPVSKIKFRDHEISHLLYTLDYDLEYGVHEKLIKHKEKKLMGNHQSAERFRESGDSPGSSKEIPRHRKAKAADSDEDDGYVVSRIKTANLTDDGPKFLVEWKYYPCEDTWETYENCGECAQMDHFEKWWPTINEDDAREVLTAFQLFVKRNLDMSKNCDIAVLLRLSETKLTDLKRDKQELEEQKRALIQKVNSLYWPLIQYNLKDEGDQETSKMKISTLITLATKRLHVERLDEIMDLKDKRVDALKKLQQIKDKMNEAIETLRDGPSVEIENWVDDEIFQEFTYVKDYEIVDVNYDDQTCVTCNCDDKCMSSKCPCLNEHPRAYDQFKNLILGPGKPIYECNPRCSCGITCKMRVISEGRKYRLCIFKTDDKRGWGLKALDKIPAKRFVVHYTGELLTVSESEKRESTRPEYNRYLFALDYAPVVGVEGLEENVIDANNFGNLSRFINHSCKPNMDCYVSWSHNLNPNTPTIAFFSRVDIEPGTELTFDYKADIYNRHEIKGIPDILAEDDEFFFRGDPSLRYCPGEAGNAQASGSSDDENEEFTRKGKKSKRPGSASRGSGPKRHTNQPGVQHHLTAEFHEKCYCGSSKCRVYLS